MFSHWPSGKRILYVLQQRGASTQAELAIATGLSRAVVSTALARLVKAGMVRRRPLPIVRLVYTYEAIS